MKVFFIQSIHNDKGHIHNHIIFNSVPISGGKKYRETMPNYFKIRAISDKLCQEHSLSVIEPTENRGKCYKEHLENKRGTSWKSALREALDRCIQKAKDWDEFLLLMQAENYEIKQGKHISFRAKGQERFTRAKTLGGRYSESKIRATLQGKIKTAPAQEVKFKDSGVSLIIDIDNCIKAKQSAGYAYWADMHNLKMAAMTVNYLTDNGLFVYENLAAKQDELRTKRDSSLARIQVVEKRIKQLNSQIKDLETYRKNKTVVDGLEKVVFKDKYKREHESEFILFNAAKQSLKAHFPSGKYPLIKELRAENKDLYSEKNLLYADYYSAKDEYKTLTTLKSNVDFILEPDEALDLFEKEHSQRKTQEKKTTLE